ncbi:MAG TPA: protein kinase [Polyangiaceae bacterium]|nr:protein kinase [Polyangiaceae bacterium]
MSLKELPLPSIASLRAIAALRSPHLALVRPARIGLGFESTGTNQKTLLEVEELLGGPGRLSLPYSLRWLLDVLTGLSVMHRTLSFVHGEVQPEHVVLGEDGVGRLVPVVRAHWVRGEQRAAERLYYLAPEKLLGDKVDVRSDVFSVGIMLWEALAGQRLLEATQVDDIIARMMGGGIPCARVPEPEAWTAPLIEIADRAVAVDPGRRFATVAQMKEALESSCLRYLASPPGMAELFQNPEQRARTRLPDSAPPESQRVTVPPNVAAIPRTSTPPGGAGAIEPVTESSRLDASADRRARSSFGSEDSEEDVTTIPPPPPPAPVAGVVTTPTRSLGPPIQPSPVARKGAHVNTLLGVPPPFIPRRTPAGADQVKAPAASHPPPDSTAPTLMVALPAMNVTVPVGTPAPVVTPRPPPEPAAPPAQSFPPPRVNAPSMSDWDEAAPASGAQRLASISPLVAAEADPAEPIEPIELVRPHKKRGAVWLVLGAALAIAAFAARPWLARQVAAATGALPAQFTPNVDSTEPPRSTTPIATTAEAAATPLMEPSADAPAVGIASTPAMPSERPPRFRPGRHEQHVVIDDREQLEQRPPEPPPLEEKPEPAPATSPPPPPPPPPAPKPKPPPVSDADRYGI